MNKILFFVLLMLSLIRTGFGGSSSSNRNENKKFQSDKDRTPKFLINCLEKLDRTVPDSLKIMMKNGPEKDMIEYHMGLGLYIRNNWGLRGNGDLKNKFNEIGIFHPDDMTGIIFDSYWRKLNGKPILLNQQVQYYKNYWMVNTGPKNYISKLCPEEISEIGSFCSDDDVFENVCRTIFLGKCTSQSKYLAWEWNKEWYLVDSSMARKFNEN